MSENRSTYGGKCLVCGTHCTCAEERKPAATPKRGFIPDERIEWRGQRWFVADVQDDAQHCHLTIVPVPEPSEGEKS